MEQIELAPAVQEKQRGFLAAYREILPAVVRHPATWLRMLSQRYLFDLTRRDLGAFLYGSSFLALFVLPAKSRDSINQNFLVKSGKTKQSGQLRGRVSKLPTLLGEYRMMQV